VGVWGDPLRIKSHSAERVFVSPEKKKTFVGKRVSKKRRVSGKKGVQYKGRQFGTGKFAIKRSVFL